VEAALSSRPFDRTHYIDLGSLRSAVKD